MVSYVLVRLVSLIFTLFVVSLVTFFLMRAVPGDPWQTGEHGLPEATQQAREEQYGFDDPVIVGTVEKIYEAAWPAFLETYASRLSVRFLGVLERLGAAIGPLAERLASGPVTVLHGDFRADNLFFGGTDGKEAVWAIDWQIACIGTGVFDAAYFLSQSVSADAETASERVLLEGYHQALMAGGVADYPLERCLADYRRAVIYGLVYVVIACGLMGAADARSARLCDALLRRVEPFALEHDTPSLL